MSKNNNTGFTLIELIMVLILGGIVAALLAPFMGSALNKSHEPLENLKSASELGSEMAKLVGKYRINEDIEDLKNDLGSFIDTNKVEIDFNNFVKFTPSGGDYNEENWNNGTEVKILKVTLQSKENPGESVTYYFPEKLD